MFILFGKSKNSHLVALVGVVCLISAIGCGGQSQQPTNRLETSHNVTEGYEGKSSINGLHVLAEMYEQAGWEVRHSLPTSESMENAKTIVWAPDDFSPPSPEQRSEIEVWLRGDTGRTFVYIGRDYDAEPTYWEAAMKQSSGQQKEEMAHRQAVAEARFSSDRRQMPSEEYAGWMTVRRDGPPKVVTEFTGKWADGITPGAAQVRIEGRFDVPTQDERLEGLAEFNAAREGRAYWNDDLLDDDSDEPPWEQTPAARRLHQRQTEYYFNTLLAADDEDQTPIVTSVQYYRWKEGQVLVLTNGSFVYNLPLINHEHRKLAGKLINRCGTPGEVVFWHSGTQIADRPELPNSEGRRSIFHLLTVWPLNFMLIHSALLAILFCLWKFPIFGRPHHLPDGSTSEFDAHIIALGELMSGTQQADYARARVKAWQELSKNE